MRKYYLFAVLGAATAVGGIVLAASGTLYGGLLVVLGAVLLIVSLIVDDEARLKKQKSERDECETRLGERVRVKGNCNVVDGKRICDYCHKTKILKEQEELLQNTIKTQQVKIDELMLEYCPEKMSLVQLANYKKHKRMAKTRKIHDSEEGNISPKKIQENLQKISKGMIKWGTSEMSKFHDWWCIGQGKDPLETPCKDAALLGAMTENEFVELVTQWKTDTKSESDK